MEQTTSRLRKTFHYPTENDSDDSLPEALDEEEQENLIQHLTALHTKYNTLYTRILLCLPLISIIPYFLTLFNPTTSLLSILSITSLLSTAFLIYTLPAEKTAISILDNLNQSDKNSTLSKIRVNGVDNGPLETYLPTLNLVLSLVLGILGALLSNPNTNPKRLA
ncbi:hypothetical protein DID88_003252 [Monilinia fructigena]|uniref:Uncharacterized protein n=1 Tax=Monilinia fructigena TaxID=38457 RepID=A0A395IW17_9HELO|nr:hypothetical protein DID88_003252 [Monilinia fructigena]